MMGALLAAALGVADHSTAGMMGIVSAPAVSTASRGSPELLAVPVVFLIAAVRRTPRLARRVVGLGIAALLRHGTGMLWRRFLPGLVLASAGAAIARRVARRRSRATGASTRPDALCGHGGYAGEDRGMKHPAGHDDPSVDQNGRHAVNPVVGGQHPLPRRFVLGHVEERERDGSLRKKLFRLDAVASGGIAVNDNLGHGTPFRMVAWRRIMSTCIARHDHHTRDGGGVNVASPFRLDSADCPERRRARAGHVRT